MMQKPSLDVCGESHGPKALGFALFTCSIASLEALHWTVRSLKYTPHLAPGAVIVCIGLWLALLTAYVQQHRSALALFAVYYFGFFFLPSFPLNSLNHWHFQLVVLLPLIVVNLADPNQARLTLNYWRSAYIVLLVGAGIQKLLHSTYFNGEYLAYLLLHDPFFKNSPFWSWLPPHIVELHTTMPADVVAHFLQPVYAHLTFVMVALGELIIPLTLTVPKLRTIAVLVNMLLLISLQLFAFEWVFAFACLGFPLLFLRDNLSRLLQATALIGYPLFIFFRFAF